MSVAPDHLLSAATISGVVFAVAFVMLQSGDWLARPTLLPALPYGRATVVIPLFIMQPALGGGVEDAEADAGQS